MSNLRPCKDPRICGVQNHRPGTTCQAERASSLGGLASNLTSAPPSSRVSDISTSVQIARSISEQEGWSPDDIDEWDGGFFGSSTPPINMGRSLSERDGASLEEVEKERENVAIAVVVHDPRRGNDHVSLAILDQDEGIMDVPDETVPEYVSKDNGDPYHDQFTCAPEDVPRAMKWLKDDAVPAAINGRLDGDYPHTKPTDASAAVAALRSADGWHHDNEHDPYGRFTSVGETHSAAPHLPEEWDGLDAPGFPRGSRTEYKVTGVAEHDFNNDTQDGLAFYFSNQAEGQVALHPEDLPPNTTPAVWADEGVYAFSASASDAPEVMKWMNREGGNLAAKRYAESLAANREAELQRLRENRSRIRDTHGRVSST